MNTPTIFKKFIPVPSSRRSGIAIGKVTYIVCHDTGNDGTDAITNVNYFIQSANTIQASAHAFVDAGGVVQCLPLTEKAWHVRYDADIAPNVAPNFANDHAIGVELCYSTKGLFDTKKSYANYVSYIASLLIQFSLPVSCLVQHSQLDPARRTDPMNAFATIGKTWAGFLADVGAIIKSVPNTKNTMDNTQTPADTAQTQAEIQAMPQEVKVKAITVTFDRYENGGMVQEGATVNLRVTPELVADMKLADAGLVEAGYNVTVDAE